MPRTPEWTKASAGMRQFNGLVCSRVDLSKSREAGIFKEKHCYGGRSWAVRYRPVDSMGEATDSWGYASPFETKRDALAYAEKEG